MRQLVSYTFSNANLHLGGTASRVSVNFLRVELGVLASAPFTAIVKSREFSFFQPFESRLFILFPFSSQYSPTFFFLRLEPGAWRDYSVAKSSSCFCRGLRLSSHYPHTNSHLSASPVPGNPMPSSGLRGHSVYIVHRHTRR